MLLWLRIDSAIFQSSLPPRLQAEAKIIWFVPQFAILMHVASPKRSLLVQIEWQNMIMEEELSKLWQARSGEKWRRRYWSEGSLS